MSVGQKLTMLKIRSTSVKFLTLRDLEAAPEEAMQLRRLIKSSNESLGPYLFGTLQYLKKPASNRVNEIRNSMNKPDLLTPQEL